MKDLDCLHGLLVKKEEMLGIIQRDLVNLNSHALFA